MLFEREVMNVELKQILGNTWCLSGHQIIPLYRTDSTHCILLDTGASALRNEIVSTLEQNKLIPIGLLCTHTHFDHFGNASFLSQRYQCPVGLPLGEAEICRTLASVKSHLFVFTAGQVASDPEMREIPCLVDHVIRPEENDTLFRGVLFKILHTPGHSLDHVSYITPDRVCYIGDALMCDRTLHTSRLPYAFDFKQSIKTIQSLHGIQCDAMVVAHCGVLYHDFDKLVDENLSIMLEQLDIVKGLADHAMTSDEISSAVCSNMGISVSTPKKAQSLERFLRPYLEYMVDSGSHRMVMRGTSLCYEPVSK